MKIKSLIMITFLTFFMSCKEDPKYGFFYDLPKQEMDKRIYPLSLLESDKNIDILFVIDNSGSMYNLQQNVINNSKIFMEQFATQPYINWKIGMVSTDKSEAPYIGFDSSFDWTLVDSRDPTSLDRTVQTFQDSVARLGTNGDASEYVFYNIKRVLDLYDGRGTTRSRFLRSDSHLVVIMVTDEMEQSKDDFGALYDAPEFFNTMSSYIAGNKILRFYGALNRVDLPGCNSPGDQEPYKGSQYEKIIDISNGFHISACLPDFGNELARVGKDIASLVGLPSLLLKQRPKPETLRVYYKDRILAPGPKDLGGIWYYDDVTNTINFYTMEFVQDIKNDYFKIDFDVDDGLDRS